MTASTRVLVTRTLSIAAVAGVCWAAAVWLTEGFSFTIGPLRFSSRTPWRPLASAFVLATVAMWLTGPVGRANLAKRVGRAVETTRARTTKARRLVPRPALVAAWLAVSVGAVSWVYGSKTASGPDSFAYVSQAALWRSGRLDLPIPLARRAPWPNAPATFAPFGYRASADGGSLVPITAPGVPMLMAALQTVGGHSAAYLVTPAAGSLAIWLTFLIGRRVHSDAIGLAAGWLVATSPAFLFMLMWPMTDIAAAAAAAAVIVLLLAPGRRAAALAGLAASAGILVRPNFAIIAAAAGGWVAVTSLVAARSEGHRALGRVAAFGAGLAPGVAITAALNLRWSGSIAASGYGNADDLFSIDRVTLNASRYAAWLAETSPILLVGLAAMAVPVATLWGRPGWRVSMLLAMITLATTGVYLVYQPFTDWWYLRFLLPAWPALSVGASLVVIGLAGRVRAAAVLRVLGVVVVLAAGFAGMRMAWTRGIFGLGEERYVSVARLVATSTEPTAVILTIQHSGTIRYYAGRETLRLDLLDPAWLNPAIEWLHARGRHPYILVEDWELPDFRNRFGASGESGRLTYRPTATWEWTRVSGRVFLYDPIDRDKHGTADPGPLLERDQKWIAPSSFPRLAFERQAN